MHRSAHIMISFFLFYLMFSVVLLGLFMAGIQMIGMLRNRKRDESPSVFAGCIALLLMAELFISFPAILSVSGMVELRNPMLFVAGPAYYFSMLQVSYGHAAVRRGFHYLPALIVILFVALTTSMKGTGSDFLLGPAMIHFGIYLLMVNLLTMKYKVARDFRFHSMGTVTWICWFRIMPLLAAAYGCSLLCMVLWKNAIPWSFLNSFLLTFILLDLWMVVISHVKIKR